ncbi:MAG TPA: TonB family protein, partial [Thermoanaerobaculia bacterium]|nr:TonB family protein [Thermoanaerobaculia bacterium]
DEPDGRTLDSLLTKSRKLGQRIPFEHALLIAEKVATALDHAYNTTVDEERTLHGLIWPGFVSISDEGETRLVGFGLAPGFFSSFPKPRFAREIAPYLAPEERNERRVARNSDVYSVGVLLLELLTGRIPSPDPVAEMQGARVSHPIPPEAGAVLAMCLAPAESRYQSSGDLRRELGKLLFSGSSSPSTFNLTFFLSQLFAFEIEAEKKARARESTLDPASARQMPLPTIGPPPPAAARPSPVPPAPAASAVSKKRRRPSPLPVGGGLLLTLAIIGALWLIVRGPSSPRQQTLPARARSPATAALPPAPQPVPTSTSTTGMSEAEFRQEVSRRVAEELNTFEREMKQTPAAGPEESRALVEPAEPPAGPKEVEVTVVAAAREIEPTPSVAAATRGSTPETAQPTPSAAVPAESSAAAIETPPRILKIVKPRYPPIALQARIGGVVVLRVLVSETGTPINIEVAKAAGGGLTDAAAAAVRQWTFEPARRNGIAVQAWTTIPIPFQP